MSALLMLGALFVVPIALGNAVLFALWAHRRRRHARTLVRRLREEGRW